MRTYEIVHLDAKSPKLYGGALKMWRSKHKEIILHGPYETGKTFAVLVKLHALLCKYEGAQALMVRQVYADLLKSARLTFEKKVLPYPPGHDRCPITSYGKSKPEFYSYPNGSQLWLGGLDKPGKVLSSEYDFIYINQVEEIELNAYETLTARATGRAGNTPYPQVLGDCNPSYPGHWILDRSADGTIELHQQLHKHNPMLFDPETGAITEQGKRTMHNLSLLTGIRKQRGLDGLWVAAEGVVYDNFSLEHNIEEVEYNPNEYVYWGVDDGYAHGDGIGSPGYHPRVILIAQQRGDGGFNILDEYVRTLELPERSIHEVLQLPYDMPVLAQVDSSAAELRRRLADKGIVNGGATHRIEDGIKVVRRFICDGQDVRLLKIHPRCKHLIRELQSYRYDDRSSVVVSGERKPLKRDDHCTDALRYLLYNFK